MPGQGIVVNILAKIEGWLAQLKLIQDAMKNIKVGSEISKSMEKELKQVESIINNLGKNMNHRLTSDSLITSFTDKIKEIENLFNSLGTRMSGINLNDINPDYITANFKDLLTAIEAANTALNAGIDSSIHGAIADSKELSKEFEKMKIDPKDLNLDQIREVLLGRGNELAKELLEAKKESEKLKQEMDEAIAKRDALLLRSKDIGNADVKAQQLLGVLPTNGTILDDKEIKTKVDDLRAKLISLGATKSDLKILPDIDTLMRNALWDKIPLKLAEILRKVQLTADTDYAFAAADAKTKVHDWRVGLGAVVRSERAYNDNIRSLDLLENLIKTRVEEETRLLRLELEQLKLQLSNKATASVKGTGNTVALNSAAGFRDATDAAEKYRAQLDLVKAGEQMLGKLLGVVQRWFSIYAVIRMVSNAIKQAAKNIQELDATMTEIAIVTKMDQSDLWKQMPQYTAMAREYASSIKGVYEVSQIYYQQGLLMNEVMSLTESTLKMARISGLGYSEAADYMTNAVRSFKMEMSEATRVVDVYSAVAASSASNVTELATAMSKTASSAQAVGSSFENTTAMLAVMIEATRESPENIGSAMKSIISRYGELKENKTGIDSEGEEYSLNKVDKALQSIGISIHDAKGEFRDFDDVIFELAEHWNEVDKNTQRYIATVMAGNRQQSRFLALVSSSDRLKEEREKAENSENASQLQFLKSLDSIDAKKLQLQTSILSIYTSSGIQDVYKGLLDFANNVLITFDNLSSASGLGTAIAKIGSTFMTLATLVTNVFNLIKGRMAIASAEITALSKLAIAERLNDTEMEANQEISAQLRVTESFVSEEEKRTAAHEAAVARRNADTLKLESKMKSRRMGAGMIASTAGLALTTAAASLDVNKDREKKSLFTAGGGILSGIGTGLMMGGWIGAVMGTLTAIPSIIEAIGISAESTQEKIDRLTLNITDTNNETIKSKDDLKTLTDYKNKYEELSKSQHESAEKQKEFKDLLNEIAEKYPSLISSMDSEGNYVVDMASAYQLLAEAKQMAYSESFAKNVAAELEGLSDIDYVLKSIYNITAGESEKIFGIDIDNYDKLAQYYVKSFNEVEKYKGQIIPKEAYINDLGVSTYRYDTGYTSLNAEALERLFFNNNIHNAGLLTRDKSDFYLDKLLAGVYNSYILSAINGIAYDNIEVDTDSIFDEVKEVYGKSSEADINVNPKKYRNAVEYGAEHFDPEQYKLMVATYKANAFSEELRQNAIRSSNADYIKTLNDTIGDSLDSNKILQYAVKKGLDVALDKYLKDNLYKIDNKEKYQNAEGEDVEYTTEKLVLDFYADKNALWYQGALEENAFLNTDAMEEIYTNLGQITRKNITEKLSENVSDSEKLIYKLLEEWLASSEHVESLENGDISSFLEEYDLDETLTELFKLMANTLLVFLEAFDEYYSKIVERYLNWAKTDLIKQVSDDEVRDTIASFGDLFGPEYLQGILDLYKAILKNTALSTSELQQLIQDLTNIFSLVGGLDTNILNTVLLKLLTADLTSINGIYSFLEILANIEDLDLDKGAGKDLKEKLKELSNNIRINVTTEINSYFDSVEKAAEGFDKSLSSAMNGMDLKTAKELADKIGVSLLNFTIKDGKFYFDDLKKIQEAYVLDILDGLDQIKENVQSRYGKMEGKTIRTPKGHINGSDILSGKYDMAEMTRMFGNEQGLKAFETWAEIDYNEFIEYYEEFLKYKKENPTADLLTFIGEQVDEESEESINAITDWLTLTLAISELKSGQIENFLQTTGNWKSTDYLAYYNEALSQFGNVHIADEIALSAVKDAESENAELMDAIRSGMVENLPENLKQYAKLIYDTYHGVYSSISSSMNTAISGGVNSMFVDDTNIGALQELYDEGFFKKKVDENGDVIDNYQLLKGDILSLTDEVINGEKSLNTWINEHYTNASDKIKALSEYYSAVSKNTAKTSTDMMGKTDTLEFDETAKYLLDVGAFDFETQSTDSAEYAEVLKKYGLEFNEATGRFIIKNLEAYLAALKADVENLGTDATDEEKTAALAAYDAGINRVSNMRTEAINKLFSNYAELTTEDLESFANAFNIDYELVKELVTDNGKGGFKLDFLKARGEINWQHDVGNISDTQYQMYNELLAKNTDEYLANMSDAVSLVSKGTTKREDILKFISNAKDVGMDINESAFRYDRIINAWTLDASIMSEYIEKQQLQLVDAGLITQAEAKKYIKNNIVESLANEIDIAGFFNAENNEPTSLAYTKFTTSIKNYISTFSDDTIKKMAQNIDEMFGVDSGFFVGEDLTLPEATIGEYKEEVARGYAEILNKGGKNAVTIIKDIMQAQGKEVTSSDIELAYRSEVAKIEDALDQLSYSAGSLVSGKAAEILSKSTDYQLKWLDSSNAVITLVGDIGTAYEEYYKALYSTGEATLAALNEAKAKVYETKEGRAEEQIAIDMLDNALSMTYTEFGEILSNLGIEMTDNLMSALEEANVIESLGGNLMRINDFDAFAKAMNWDFNSEQYIKALLSYNESLIAFNKEKTDELLSEVNALKDAKGGQLINITKYMANLLDAWELKAAEQLKEVEEELNKKSKKTSLQTDDENALRRFHDKFLASAEQSLNNFEAALSKYNASIENGILTLADNANLLGIAQVLKRYAQDAGLDLENDMAELTDTISSILLQYTDLLDKGISGTLTAVEALNLKNQAAGFGINNISFEKTAEGLLLSQTSAIRLYYALKEVDGLQATLTFNKLRESLEKTNEHFRTTTGLAARIEELSRKINGADGEVSEVRLKQYKAELAVAKEILAVRSGTEDSSFNFMSNEIPGALNNPINYYNNWAEAFSKVRKALSTRSKTHVNGKLLSNRGLIDYQDWYNIVNEIGNLVNITGNAITLGKKTLSNSKDVEDLLEASAAALTVDSNGLVKVALSSIAGLGLDFLTGATDMANAVDDGIRAVAKSLVEMLDGIISMLELVVAMEKLGDIDVKGNGIDFTDIFEFDTDIDELSEDWYKHIVRFSETFNRGRDKVLATLNDDLKLLLKHTRFTLFGKDNSLYDLLDSSKSFDQLFDVKNLKPEDKKAVAESYTNFIKGLYEMALDGDWDDQDNLIGGFQEQLAKHGLDMSQLSYDVFDDKGKIVRTIAYTGSTLIEIDWTDDVTKKTFEEKLKEAKKTDPNVSEDKVRESIIAALKSYNEGQGATNDFTLEEVVKLSHKTKFETKTKNNKPEYYVDGKLVNEAEYEEEIRRLAFEDIGAINVDKEAKDGDIVINQERGTKVHVVLKDDESFEYSIEDKDISGSPITGTSLDDLYTKYYEAYVAKQEEAETPEFEILGKKAFLYDKLGINYIVEPTFKDDKDNTLGADSAAVQLAIRNWIKDNGAKLAQDAGGGDYTYTVSGKTLTVTLTNGITLDLDATKFTVNEKIDDDALSNYILGLSLTTLVEQITQGIAKAFGEAGVPIDNLKVTAQAVTTEGEVVVNDIAEATGTITHLIANVTSVDAEGNITGVEITGQLDGKEIHVKIDKDGAKGDIAEILKALDTLHREVTVTINSSGIEEILRAIDSIKGKLVYVDVIKRDSGPNEATGNVGLARAAGTLMGELGPELVVSNGRYFVAGLNGPEMVDLAKDAIVFNHLQTKSLLEKGMSTGRGKAVTNERNAVSFATGNVNGGPALASASSALSALKQLRALWQALAGLSAKDLASKGGGGGGGNKEFLKDLERWYNWLQEIAKLEKLINYEEAKRARILSDFNKDGKEYYNSLKRSLTAIEKTIQIQKDLNKELEAYFNKRRSELNSANNPFSQFYTFDEDALIKYTDRQFTYKGKTFNGGFEALAEINKTDAYGNTIYNPDEQLEMMKAFLGADVVSKYSKNSDGSARDAAETLEAIWSSMEANNSELQGLYDSVEEGKTKVELDVLKQNEILKAIEDNLIAVENRVLEAIEDAAQREIDKLQDLKDAIEKANEAYIKGLTDALNKERQMYETSLSESDLASKRRRLAVLQRSGGSASEISSLQAEIDSDSKELYFTKQQEQIDAIQEASDNELLKLLAQIDLMTETLEYEKANGLLWNQVYEVMQGSPEDIAAFIELNNSKHWAESPTQFAQSNRDIMFETGLWRAYADDSGKTNSDVTELLRSIEESVAKDRKSEASSSSGGDSDSSGSSGSSSGGSSGGSGSGGETPSDTPGTKKYTATAELTYINTDYGLKTVKATESSTKDITTAKERAKEAAMAKAINYRDTVRWNIYKQGGLADYTGPAWLDGTKSAPEAVLTAEQTRILREDILGGGDNSLLSLLQDFRSAMANTVSSDKYATTNNENGTTIEHAEVNIHVDKLSDKYDSAKVGEDVMREMLNIARKTLAQNRVGR